MPIKLLSLGYELISLIINQYALNNLLINHLMIFGIYAHYCDNIIAFLYISFYQVKQKHKLQKKSILFNMLAQK